MMSSDKDLLNRVDELLVNTPALQNLFRDIRAIEDSHFAKHFNDLTPEEKKATILMSVEIGRFIDKNGWPEKYGDKAILNMFMGMQRAALKVMLEKSRKQKGGISR